MKQSVVGKKQIASPFLLATTIVDGGEYWQIAAYINLYLLNIGRCGRDYPIHLPMTPSWSKIMQALKAWS